MFKRCFLIATATIFVSSLANVSSAQLFRSCPGGNCPTATYSRVRVVNVQHVYNPYSYQTAATTVAPCEQATETVEAPEPCAPVQETVEPCAPVQTTCERGEYIPTDEGMICVNGSCPIRTTVKIAAKATKGVARSVAKTAGWLAAVNRTRAMYGLTALKGDATLDAGCAEATNHCATVGGLDHTAGNEILAYNTSGIDAAIQSWLESPAHRAYLLSSNFKVAGVSVVRDKYGRVWCAMRFR